MSPLASGCQTDYTTRSEDRKTGLKYLEPLQESIKLPARKIECEYVRIPAYSCPFPSARVVVGTLVQLRSCAESESRLTTRRSEGDRGMPLNF